MLRFLLCAFLLLIGTQLWAQSHDEFLRQYNADRLQRQKVGMLVLGTWAVGNIATGLVLQGRHSGSEKQFHLMNAGWNAVNLGIAAFGYINAMKADPASFGLYETAQQQHGFQKALLFNAGLDVGYVMGGLYLMERSKNAEKNVDQLKGFGKSIILQGSFLFVFDLVNYFINVPYNKELAPLMSSVYFDGQQFGLVLQF